MPRHAFLKCSACRRRSFQENGRLVFGRYGWTVVFTGRERATAKSALGNGAGKVSRELICIDCGHVGWTSRNFARRGGSAEPPPNFRPTLEQYERLVRIYARGPIAPPFGVLPKHDHAALDALRDYGQRHGWRDVARGSSLPKE